MGWFDKGVGLINGLSRAGVTPLADPSVRGVINNGVRIWRATGQVLQGGASAVTVAGWIGGHVPPGQSPATHGYVSNATTTVIDEADPLAWFTAELFQEFVDIVSATEQYAMTPWRSNPMLLVTSDQFDDTNTGPHPAPPSTAWLAELDPATRRVGETALAWLTRLAPDPWVCIDYDYQQESTFHSPYLVWIVAPPLSNPGFLWPWDAIWEASPWMRDFSRNYMYWPTAGAGPRSVMADTADWYASLGQRPQHGEPH